MNILHGVLFVAHLTTSIGAVIVLLVMRHEARTGGLSVRPAQRNVAVRLAHAVPVTGAGVIATSHGEISWHAPWVAVGVVCYLAAALLIELRAVPAERRLRERDHASDVDVVTKATEWTLVTFVVAALAMLVQW